MKRFLLCFTAFLIASGISASAQIAESRQAKIERILTITNSQALVNQMFDQVKTMMTSQMKSQMAKGSPEQVAQFENFQSKLIDMMKERFSWDKMRPEYIKIYSELYSDDEIDGMLAFYQSPAGQGFVKKMPELTRKTMGIAQSVMADLVPEIQRMAQEATQGK